MSEYFVLVRNETVYVKEGEFFRSQGGTTQDWGKNWKAIDAESVDDARRKTLKEHGIEKPIWITNPRPDSWYRAMLEDKPKGTT